LRLAPGGDGVASYFQTSPGEAILDYPSTSNDQ
jgi:hypothetical protein